MSRVIEGVCMLAGIRFGSLLVFKIAETLASVFVGFVSVR